MVPLDELDAVRVAEPQEGPPPLTVTAVGSGLMTTAAEP